MYYKRANLRFRCTQCGACCTGRGDSYIAVGPREAERIREHLGLSKSWFRRRYLIWRGAEQRGLRLLENGACTFLDSDGRCRIYPVRPVQCRSYPFWPEVVETKSAWLTEALRCEGIGRGDVVPVRRIERLLQKQRAHDDPHE